MDAYLEHVFRFAPEEAAALGARRALALRDPSLESLEREARAARALLSSLEGDDLDTRWARRALEFRVHTIERGDARKNLELVALPHALVQYLLARGIDPSAIVMAIPGYLARLREAWRGEPGPWEPSVVECFVQYVIPSVRSSFEARGWTDAADAYELTREAIAALPVGPAPLGRDEVAWRLASFGLEPGIDAIEADARAALDEHAAEATAVAAELGLTLEPGLVGRFDAPLDDVAADLRARADRATRFLQERGLFALPSSFQVRLHPAPPAMDAGNWPCPLLDERAEGALLVPSSWPAFWADVYAVHEGAPGHYLQSFVWQRSAQSIARHVGVADDLAAASHDFAPLVGIEGWAVYAEELMREAGYFEGLSRLAVLVSHAIRAVRALVDLGLACGAMRDDEAVALYTHRAWMPERWARMQLVRHRRVPLQGLTYFAGRRAIERLRASSSLSRADFHARLLAEGPVSPDLLRPALGA
jgi:hypothetical protein